MGCEEISCALCVFTYHSILLKLDSTQGPILLILFIGDVDMFKLLHSLVLCSMELFVHATYQGQFSRRNQGIGFANSWNTWSALLRRRL